MAKILDLSLEAAARRNPLIAMKPVIPQDVRLTRYEEFVAQLWPRKIPIQLAGTFLLPSERFP